MTMTMTMTMRSIMNTAAFLTLSLSLLVACLGANSCHAFFVPLGGQRQISSFRHHDFNSYDVHRTASAPLLVLYAGNGGGNGPLDAIMGFLKEGKVGLVKSLAGEYDAVAIRDKINSLVKENAVFMFSFTTCPYCIKAKTLLDEKGAKYTVVELDKEADGKAIRAELGEVVGRTSVPAIWINGQFIGGCNDGPPPYGGLSSLSSNNKIDEMLKTAGAL